MKRFPVQVFPALCLTVLLLVPACLLVSCGDKAPDIPLPETSVLVHRDSIALVSVEYARMHREPSIDSPVMVHSRFGDILSVSERTPDERWLYLVAARREGWVYRDDVALYMSDAQAQSARRQLRRPGER
ncbi:hypothetical protein SAMN05920897_11361 [Alkalispirochaeta americana]|uniref:SH3 domain-containing protein n=1 Tax=Alkalispirochaeta americana TaxID=159291 RepID=A0A1N6UXU3_9SPIO|nr:hypothetical protein [Alkalispirochaeta americana]SIQ70369.1 hypothetical protein SAMN05920897_11361 [Alkalispirochaeta americana]